MKEKQLKKYIFGELKKFLELLQKEQSSIKDKRQMVIVQHAMYTMGLRSGNELSDGINQISDKEENDVYDYVSSMFKQLNGDQTKYYPNDFIMTAIKDEFEKIDDSTRKEVNIANSIGVMLRCVNFMQNTADKIKDPLHAKHKLYYKRQLASYIRDYLGCYSNPIYDKEKLFEILNLPPYLTVDVKILAGLEEELPDELSPWSSDVSPQDKSVQQGRGLPQSISDSCITLAHHSSKNRLLSYKDKMEARRPAEISV